ncbi:MAG: phosphorylase [Bacteroidetes bacterium]|nr:phosphorylase [Bacteroidota bacterium]
MKDSELILRQDGSIYHLAIKPHQLANRIITVGDPDRVSMVSKYFDHIYSTAKNREFVIHTGRIGNTDLTCMSTGMGSGNIDIVMNELDALVNIDLEKRHHKTQHTALTIVRVGTSGSISDEIHPGEILYSSVAIGLEGIMLWYRQSERNKTEEQWHEALNKTELPIDPYVTTPDAELENHFSGIFKKGITLTTAGFYAPQSRSLRLEPVVDDLIGNLMQVRKGAERITNIEMETAAIYGLAAGMGHKAMSVNAILANRITGEFASNPDQIVIEAIEKTLSILCN